MNEAQNCQPDSGFVGLCKKVKQPYNNKLSAQEQLYTS